MSSLEDQDTAKMGVEDETTPDMVQKLMMSKDRVPISEASLSHEDSEPTADRHAIIVDLMASPKPGSLISEALNEEEDARAEDARLPSVPREAQPNSTESQNSAPSALDIAHEAHTDIDGAPVPAAAQTEATSAPQRNTPAMHKQATGVNIRVKGRKHFHGFIPYTDPLPTAWRILPLDQLARYYPNHFSGQVLRRFLEGGWGDQEISRAMHPDAQMQLAATGANYLRKYLIKEKKIIKDEEDGGAPRGLGFTEANLLHPAPNWYRPQEIALWKQTHPQASTETQINAETSNLRRRSQTQDGRRTASSASQVSHRPILGPDQRSRPRSPRQPDTIFSSRETLQSHLPWFTQSSGGVNSNIRSTPPREDAFSMMVRIWRNRHDPSPISDDQLSHEFFHEYGWSPLEENPYRDPSDPDRRLLPSNMVLVSFMTTLNTDSSAKWPLGRFEKMASTGQPLSPRVSEGNQSIAADRDSAAPVSPHLSPSILNPSTNGQDTQETSDQPIVTAPSILPEADNRSVQASDDKCEEGSIPAERPE
ncbi:MAG: hypothetical protein Q9160_004258 [Pyrenula sp. 1 TL-2023]